MEKAHSQIPFLPFSNAYCIKDNYFSIPIRPCIKDSLYGTVNEEYLFLSDEYLQHIEDKISEGADKMSKKLSYYVEIMSEPLNRIIASNSITKRLSGLDSKFVELEEETKLFWYPVEMSRREYSLRGSFIPPMCIGRTNPQLVTPFHRRLMIQYDYLFKSKDLHIGILNKTKAILFYINEYLPFAELIPLSENKGINISNIVTPKQVQLGSENKFDGQINIGNEGELKNGD
jgi:hypothetical protein